MRHVLGRCIAVFELADANGMCAQACLPPLSPYLTRVPATLSVSQSLVLAGTPFCRV